jgi:hypothetical protein
MIKLGQFNKVRGLIRELENSSPDDKEAAQKIAAFAEFYKNEIKSDEIYGIAVDYLKHPKFAGGDMEIIPAAVYDKYADILDQYNISNIGRFDYNRISDDNTSTYDIYKDRLLPYKNSPLAPMVSEPTPRTIIDNRTITTKDVEKFLDEGEFEKIYSLMQDLEKIADQNTNPDRPDYVSKVRDRIALHAWAKEYDRLYEANPFYMPKKFNDGTYNPVFDSYTRPIANPDQHSEAAELADFFEAKGDTETASRIHEEIKKVSDRRDKELQGLYLNNTLKFRTDGQPLRFDNEHIKTILEKLESWNALDEDSQKRLLDLLGKRGHLPRLLNNYLELEEWFNNLKIMKKQ